MVADDTPGEPVDRRRRKGRLSACWHRDERMPDFLDTRIGDFARVPLR
jgi:hypothetical protein